MPKIARTDPSLALYKDPSLPPNLSDLEGARR
jgi:hypothetical protein